MFETKTLSPPLIFRVLIPFELIKRSLQFSPPTKWRGGHLVNLLLESSLLYSVGLESPTRMPQWCLIN